MNFNRHSNLAGLHSFLSPSKPSWLNYDEDKLDRMFATAMAAQRGTELHELAHRMIRMGVKPERTKSTFNMYVNDAIGFRMEPEQVLFYSENAFGTADTISFRNRLLRIHDLKTGVNESSMHQLEVYAGFFCLEYRIEPFEIEIELRIYQNDEVRIYTPEPAEIKQVMETVKFLDKRIKYLREEAS